MKNMFRGSKIRGNTFKNLVDNFSDLGAMIKDFESVKEILGSSAYIFETYFNDNMLNLLIWQIPNRFTIKYRDKDWKSQYAHTLNGTIVALSRCLIAIIENYQTKDWDVKIPEVLKSFMWWKEII